MAKVRFERREECVLDRRLVILSQRFARRSVVTRRRHTVTVCVAGARVEDVMEMTSKRSAVRLPLLVRKRANGRVYDSRPCVSLNVTVRSNTGILRYLIRLDFCFFVLAE